MKRDILKLSDLSADEISLILKRAIETKSDPKTTKCPLIGKSIGLLFEKSSTRTRVSFEVGIYQLGAHPIYLTPNEIQIGRGETIKDTARTLSRYLDGVVIRTFGHETLIEFAKYASIPVINGLSDLHHPCQALADLLTIFEKKGRLEGISIAYIGDGNNVANSLIEAAALMSMNISIACPKGCDPDAKIIKEFNGNPKAKISMLRDPKEAVKNADVVYTDVWVSMGQEKQSAAKKKKFKGYKINKKLLSLAKKDAVMMHCLPAHRGEEITDDVIDGEQSIVFDQAENRLHAQKALLEILIV